MSERHGQDRPRFPRRRWEPGQQGRAERPKKGKGAYRRRQEQEDLDGEIDDWARPGEPPEAPPDEDEPETSTNEDGGP